MIKHLYVSLLLVLLTSCINYHGSIYNKDLYQSYKKAYVSEIKSDPFNVRPLVMDELSKMGLIIYSRSQLEKPTSEDVIIKIEFAEGWDLAKYVKSINVQFIDATTGTVVATGSYESGWIHGTKSAVEKVFSKIKSQL